jgi:hypothetical protein
MAKSNKLSVVIVQHAGNGTLGGSATYTWATDVRIDRKGNLRVFEGHQQRAFHPAGEWDSYIVKAVKAEGWDDLQ